MFEGMNIPAFVFARTPLLIWVFHRDIKAISCINVCNIWFYRVIYAINIYVCNSWDYIKTKLYSNSDY